MEHVCPFPLAILQDVIGQVQQHQPVVWVSCKGMVSAK